MIFNQVPSREQQTLDHTATADTHQVLNQPDIPEQVNLFTADTTLQYWTQKFNAQHSAARMTEYGALAGGLLGNAGFEANYHKPEFHSHNRFGHRIDEVKYHPAYHQLMQSAIEAGIPSLPWVAPGEGANVTRAGLNYLHTQADPGSGCPLTMTFAAVPSIRQNAKLAAYWMPKITSPEYDPSNRPFSEKAAVTIGMAMTEKQGGSDVRANTTHAQSVGYGEWGDEYELTGHKWFCSAPMCDAFLMLAQTDAGLSCFLVPRWRADGSKNPVHIQRLKNKVGNCSNASSEIELRGATGWLLGEPGKGVNCIIEMVALTRFDCVVGSAALMRGSLNQALLHTAKRTAFGKLLVEQPLMQNVLADLALDSEAAVATGMRLAAALDENSEQSNSLLRVTTAVSKYWVCKQAPHFCYETMETVGGVGYVEENATARNYREAPVNAIWEGSGNIQCLDVLRALAKSTASRDAFFAAVSGPAKDYPQLQASINQIHALLKDTTSAQYLARQLVESMALTFQAATLAEYGDPYVADAFIRSRLDRPHWHYGTLAADLDCPGLIQRAMPQLE